MQWSADAQAGFSRADQTWLPVNPNYPTINVAAALADKDSIFYTYQRLVALRKEADWLIDGDFELIDTAEKVFAYKRTTTDQSYLIVANLSDQKQDFQLSCPIKEIIISNTSIDKVVASQSLAAWDAFCVRLS